MTNVTDINDARAERERRKLAKQFEPSATRDLFEAGAAYVVLLCALSGVIWLLGPSDFKAAVTAALSQQETE